MPTLQGYDYMYVKSPSKRGLTIHEDEQNWVDIQTFDTQEKAEKRKDLSVRYGGFIAYRIV